MAKVKKAGINKSFKTITKELRACCDAYEKALKKLDEDLEKMQTGDEDGQAVWKGKRAKKWITDAVNVAYNKNVKDLNQLMSFTQQCEIAAAYAEQQK